MSNSKANLNKTVIDGLVQLKKEKAKQYGILRQTRSVPTSQGSPGGSSGSKGTGDGNDVVGSGAFLRKEGDSMIGPFGFTPQVTTADSLPQSSTDNTLNLKFTEGNYTSHVLIGPSDTNQLDRIESDIFTTGGAGTIFSQHLIIESTETITLTISDLSNVIAPPDANIKTLDGNDLVLGPRSTLVEFVYSVADNNWHQLTNPAIAGSGGAGVTEDQSPVTWTGIHSFNGSSVAINSPVIIIGDSPLDNVSIVGRVNTDIDPNADNVHSLGQASFRWAQARIVSVIANTLNSSVSLTATGSVFLGLGISDSINVNGRINTDLIPNSGKSLGGSGNRWTKLWTSGIDVNGDIQMFGVGSNIANAGNISANTLTVTNLAVFNGPVILGNNFVDNIVVNGRIASDLDPTSNKDLGGSGNRWRKLWTSGINVNGDIQMFGIGSNIQNVGNVSTNTITVTSTGVFNGDVSLGNSSADDITVNGELSVFEDLDFPNLSGATVDFDGNNISISATAGFATLPAKPIAFINIKVGGANFRVPYYSP